MFKLQTKLHFRNFLQNEGICKNSLSSALLITSTSRTATSNTSDVNHTALYEFHENLGGKLVNFCGYALPVQYGDQSIKASHLHTRQNASIFDVSHMLQTYVVGRDASSCIESICTANIKGAANSSSMLTVFPNKNGGILDDLIVTKINEHKLYIVSNAAMKKQDIEIMECAVSKFKSSGKDVSIEFLSSHDQSLIAIQGPKAIECFANLLPSKSADQLRELYFMETMVSEIAGIRNCRITRCGYTGEDGVEVSVSSSHVQHVTETILANPAVKMAGLGARDSLRLEAGLCLYGCDIDEKTTPIEAGLSWLVAKRRREEMNFPGAQRICRQIKEGVTRRRVGLQMNDTNVPPGRAGVSIYHNEHPIGHITSGCPSPSLNKNIAMGYLKTDVDTLSIPSTQIKLCIRDRFYNATIVRMPFIKTQYFIRRKN